MGVSISRRGLVGAAGAAAGLVAIAGMRADDALADGLIEQAAGEYRYVVEDASVLDSATWDVDVLVAGSGTAGVSAGIEALNAGLSVLMVESEGYWGGTSAGAEGIIALHSDWQVQAGADYDTAEVLKHEFKATQYLGNYNLIKDFVTSIDDNYQWMVDNGVVFEGCEHFNPCQTYYQGKGAGMIASMIAKFEELGGTGVMETRLRAVVVDSGKVVGALVEDAEGEKAVRAKAVIMATGSFKKLKDLMFSKFPWINPERVIANAGVGNYGDMQMISWAAGGETHGILTPSFYNTCLASNSGQHLPWCVAACNTPVLWVNESAQRFINEDITIRYSDCCFAAVTQRRSVAILSKSNIQRVMDEGMPVGWAAYVLTGEKYPEILDDLEDYLTENPFDCFKAATLRELAEAMALDPDALEATVREYNAYCAAGRDDDFGKDPQYLWEMPVDDEAYYGFEMVSSFGNPMGGVVIDGKMRPLTPEGKPVLEGLYAAGAGCSGPTGFQYSSDYPSTKQGWCCHTGRRAAQAAAGYLA